MDKQFNARSISHMGCWCNGVLARASFHEEIVPAVLSLICNHRTSAFQVRPARRPAGGYGPETKN